MPGTAPSAHRCATQIRRTVSQLCRKLRPSLLREGITAAKLSVLGQIYQSGRLTPTELAAREGVRLQTLTRLLAELTEEEWILRTPGETDARQTVLTLTPAGKKRLMDAAAENDGILAELIEEMLTLDERELLWRACRLLDKLDEAMTGAVARAPQKARAVR